MGFDAGGFVAAAVGETGLDDFGDGAWRDGLDAFCDALAGAGLNAVGTAMHEARIAGALRNRLGVVDWHRRHPEIARAATAEAPVIVVGLPRTGTTALAHLLAADPDSRPLRTWEAGAPIPPPEADATTAAPDPRIAATQHGIDMSHHLMPDLPRLYYATATSPSEALDLLGLSFRAFQWEGQAPVPGYLDWLLGCDMVDGYRFQRQVHQLLAWRCPPDRWTWKNPPDLFWLREVRAAFPGARFVWTHREPAAAMVSACDLISVVRAIAVDEVDRPQLGRREVALWAEGIARGLAARAELGDDAFVDVWVDDLAADAIATVAGVYARLGWPFTAEAERAMRDWLGANPRHGRGRHEPDASVFGLDPTAVNEQFAAYRQRFGREGW